MDESRPSRDPRTRYHSPGFDRWSKDALAERTIICAQSKVSEYAFDNEGSIWRWWHGDKIWTFLSPEEERSARSENECFVAAMRRALPILRIYIETPHEGERVAAHAALLKVASSVTDVFRASEFRPALRMLYQVEPGDLYFYLTQASRWQAADLQPPAFVAAIETKLYSQHPDRVAFGETMDKIEADMTAAGIDTNSTNEEYERWLASIIAKET